MNDEQHTEGSLISLAHSLSHMHDEKHTELWKMSRMIKCGAQFDLKYEREHQQKYKITKCLCVYFFLMFIKNLFIFFAILVHPLIHNLIDRNENYFH